MTVRDLIKRLALPLRNPRLSNPLTTSRGSMRPVAADGPTFLIAPTGGGNIGDEAMVEAFLENVDGPVVLVARSREAFERQAGRPGVTVLELPHLLQRGYFPLAMAEAARLRRLWSGARAVAVIGADVMDGAYIWQNSVTRANIARWAAEQGIDSRVLGFSWNEDPHPLAREALRRAGSAGVRLLARDPDSDRRLRQEGITGVELAADTVFTGSGVDESVFDQVGIDREITLAIVNSSGLVSRRIDQASSTARVVSRLVDAGFHVVLLPHVNREARDDLAALVDVYRELSETVQAHTTLVAELLSPAQVRVLAAAARIVVTGRMHLSILALSSGVPAVVVATQGKVSGLMKMFGIENLLVEPDTIASGGIDRAVEAAVDALEQLRESVAARVETVVALAEQNFRGLPGSGAGDSENDRRSQ